ncbi:MAG: long-chain fatty acid--CoA ligase [Syntrophales bacterium]|nr:long-chain fatty acid--CoA ligase [Syntrophales bacterium]
MKQSGSLSYELEKPDNLVEFLEGSVKRVPGKEAFGVRQEDGKFRWMTYGELGKRVDNLRAGLSGLGIGKGDAVGIIANNRPEWAVAAFATYGLGARFVPMYEAELPKTWQYIIQDATVKVLFVSRADVMEKLKPVIEGIATLEKVFLIEGEGPGTMTELEREGQEKPVPPVYPSADEVAVLIYTSGTTGDPKGVLLTHGNFTSNVIAGLKDFTTVGENTVTLSILPWAHSFGQTAELYAMTRVGASVGIAGSTQTILEDIQEVKPTFLIAVPRVFNRIYDGLWARMNKEGGIKKKLFLFALNAAKEKRLALESGKSPGFMTNFKFNLGDKLVFSKIRDRFGGRLIESMSGSAAMNPEIAQFFFDIGISVYDCYGLTETTPAVTVNSPAGVCLGSVGKPIDKVKVAIDDTYGDPVLGDGEIIVYGPNVMKGYHNKPEATKEVIMDDGGFRTGDRGRLNEDGFLFITGRIKEQYKLENGKYVFPAGIEEDIRMATLVENSMVYGEARPYNICLVVPDFIVLETWAQEKGLSGTPQELVDRPEVQDEIARQINSILEGKYGGYEIPRKYIFLKENFSLESGTLTQTMKLKRGAVFERYMNPIEKAYKPE